MMLDFIKGAIREACPVEELGKSTV